MIEDSQTASGEVPTSVPCPQPGASVSGCGGGDDWVYPARWGPAHCSDVAWTGGYPLIMLRTFEFSGDARPLRRHWASLTRYTENLVSKAHAFAGNVTACDPGESWWHGPSKPSCSWRRCTL